MERNFFFFTVIFKFIFLFTRFWQAILAKCYSCNEYLSIKMKLWSAAIFFEADGNLRKIHPGLMHRNTAGAEQSFLTIMLRIFSFIICHAFFLLLLLLIAKIFNAFFVISTLSSLFIHYCHSPYLWSQNCSHGDKWVMSQKFDCNITAWTGQELWLSANGAAAVCPQIS